MFGIHTIKCWAKMQSLVARSSGEAELYGAVRGACEALGLAALYRDRGHNMKIQVSLDTSAAKGIIERQGLSNFRHAGIDNVWLQEQHARSMMPLAKALGAENPADLMTKCFTESEMSKYVSKQGLACVAGRAKSTSTSRSITDGIGSRRSGDSSDARGAKGIIPRHHSTWRHALFRPMGIPGGLEDTENIEDRRLTIKIGRGGRTFQVEDRWKDEGESHVLFSGDWRGHTMFLLKHKNSLVVKRKLCSRVKLMHADEGECLARMESRMMVRSKKDIDPIVTESIQPPQPSHACPTRSPTIKPTQPSSGQCVKSECGGARGLEVQVQREGVRGPRREAHHEDPRLRGHAGRGRDGDDGGPDELGGEQGRAVADLVGKPALWKKLGVSWADTSEGSNEGGVGSDCDQF